MPTDSSSLFSEDGLLPKNNFEQILSDLPLAHSFERIKGTIRECPEDFIVTEELTFEPSDTGEHLFLLIEKKSCNTEWVARQLQQYFQLRNQDVGYAGRKDRYSVSRQWFSLHLPGQSVAPEALSLVEANQSDFHIIKSVRHDKKLKKGTIKYNHFEIRVKNISGDLDSNAISLLLKKGFPNYFGYQRFGHKANNLIQAIALFERNKSIQEDGSIQENRNIQRSRSKKRLSRNKKSIYLSAARAYLFNLQVAERIKLNNWQTIIPGDCLGFADSSSFFVLPEITDESRLRLEQGELHISGWLPGSGNSQALNQALSIENQVINEHDDWLKALASERVTAARRIMRVIPEGLELTKDGNELNFKFSLPSGSFATALLRELIDINDAMLNRF